MRFIGGGVGEFFEKCAEINNYVGDCEGIFSNTTVLVVRTKM